VICFGTENVCLKITPRLFLCAKSVSVIRFDQKRMEVDVNLVRTDESVIDKVFALGGFRVQAYDQGLLY